GRGGQQASIRRPGAIVNQIVVSSKHDGSARDPRPGVFRAVGSYVRRSWHSALFRSGGLAAGRPCLIRGDPHQFVPQPRFVAFEACQDRGEEDAAVLWSTLVTGVVDGDQIQVCIETRGPGGTGQRVNIVINIPVVIVWYLNRAERQLKLLTTGM